MLMLNIEKTVFALCVFLYYHVHIKSARTSDGAIRQIFLNAAWVPVRDALKNDKKVHPKQKRNLSRRRETGLGIKGGKTYEEARMYRSRHRHDACSRGLRQR